MGVDCAVDAVAEPHRAATQTTLGLGHRRIVLINGNLETSPAADRLAGFRAAHEEAGVPVDDRLITSGKWLIDDAESRLNRLLVDGESFTAVIGANSFMSIGSLRALRAHGLSVPDQIAVAGFDEVELASEFDPFLTIMTQPVHTMGTFAMNMLLERIDGTYSGPNREVVFAPWLVVRRSSGAPIIKPQL